MLLENLFIRGANLKIGLFYLLPDVILGSQSVSKQFWVNFIFIILSQISFQPTPISFQKNSQKSIIILLNSHSPLKKFQNFKI